MALDVRDDGQGFDPAPRRRPAARGVRRDAGPAPRRTARRPERAGSGWSPCGERIEGLAGTLEIESEPGAGTAISACIPAAAGREPPA